MFNPEKACFFLPGKSSAVLVVVFVPIIVTQKLAGKMAGNVAGWLSGRDCGREFCHMTIWFAWFFHIRDPSLAIGRIIEQAECGKVILTHGVVVVAGCGDGL